MQEREREKGDTFWRLLFYWRGILLIHDPISANRIHVRH
jgi:hypothetical protein